MVHASVSAHSGVSYCGCRALPSRLADASVCRNWTGSWRPFEIKRALKKKPRSLRFICLSGVFTKQSWWATRSVQTSGPESSFFKKQTNPKTIVLLWIHSILRLFLTSEFNS